MANIWKSDGRLVRLLRILVLHGDSPSQIRSSAVLQCIKCPSHLENKPFGEAFGMMCSSDHPVIPIGLYREANDESTAPFRFMYTNPPPTTLIHPTDFLFVLVNSKQSHLRDNMA
jgi:hypothetical protein